MKIPHTKVVHFMTPINPSISSLSVVSLIRTKYKPKLEYNPMYIMAGKVVLKCISPQESKWHNYGVSLCLFKTSKWQALGFLLLSVFISMWQLLSMFTALPEYFHSFLMAFAEIICPLKAQKMPLSLPTCVRNVLLKINIFQPDWKHYMGN